MMSKPMNQKRYLFFFLAIAVVSECFYIGLCLSPTVWADEIYSLNIIKKSILDIVRLSSLEYHPPLYFILLKIFTLPFGYSVWSGKVFSSLCFLYIILYGGISFKKLFGEKTSLLFMFLFPLYSFSMNYAAEIRMYSLGAAFVFTNGILAYRCYYSDHVRNWILFCITGICCCYIHDYSMLSAAVIYVLLFVALVISKREKLRPWLIVSAVTTILYLPWLTLIIKQLGTEKDGYWIPPVTFQSFKQYFRSLFFGPSVHLGAVIQTRKGTICALLIFLLYLSAFIKLLLKKNKPDIVTVVFMAGVPFLTMAFGVVASILITPMFDMHFLVPAAPFISAFLAVCLGKTTGKILCSLVLAASVLNGGLTYALIWRARNIPLENSMDTAFLSQYGDVDAYIVRGYVDAGYFLLSQLQHYGLDKPVFLNDSEGMSSDQDALINIIISIYDKYEKWSRFDPEKNDSVLLFGYSEPDIDDLLPYYDVSLITNNAMVEIGGGFYRYVYSVYLLTGKT